MAKNILIVAHKFLTQPDDDLVIYLNREKFDNVMHIIHDFSDAPTRTSSCRWYKLGVLYQEYSSRDYSKFPEFFLYVKEFIFTAYWVIKSKTSWTVSISMDGLCNIFCLFFRLLHKVDRTVYWAVDFVPKSRFKSIFKNYFYHFVNKIGYKNADEMWDLSPRMAQAREAYLGIHESEYKSHKVVPYGVWAERITRFNYGDCEKYTLVFMGHLLEKQGVQYVISMISKLRNAIPNFNFKIIGDGSYKQELVNLAKKLNVFEYCTFTGKIENDVDLENEIAKSCVAIAPYIRELDTWTYYADPGKLKKYIACGVPVLVTDVPWNAQIISERRCGVIINYKDFVKELLFLMSAAINSDYRNNCVEFSKSFDYNTIFAELNS